MLDYLGFPDSQDDVDKLLKVLDRRREQILLDVGLSLIHVTSILFFKGARTQSQSCGLYIWLHHGFPIQFSLPITPQ
jgi:hypothetical protein